MEKGAIIHEPLVPRTFRLLAESEKEGNGLVTYGLKDPNDNTFTFWNGSILLDDGRFYELQLECTQDYPQKPLKKDDSPISKYPKPPLIGLNNIGATCYLNATLQCLSQTRALTNYFLNEKNKTKIIN